MIANYHTHTPRCKHAEGSERSYVERGLEGGLKLLGFSDHSPYLFDTPDYYSTFRMRPEELADYVQTLQALQEEYADRIELHIGLEAEYYPKLFARLLDFLRQYPVEYLILGQHALYNEVEGIYSARPTTDRKLLDQYLGQTLEALDTGVFSYFAHPDLFCFEGDDAVYEAHVRRLCRHAMKRRIPLEFNLLGLAEARHYPNPRFWRIVGEEGCPVILGCDAHAPEGVWDPRLIARGEAMLQSFGISPLETVSLRPLPCAATYVP